MAAYFCDKCGSRIPTAGECCECHPDGHDHVLEVDGELVAVADVVKASPKPKADGGKADKGKSKAEPSAEAKPPVEPKADGGK